MTSDELYKYAEQLSPDDLEALNQRIWERLSELGRTPPVSDGLAAELELRVAGSEAEPNALSSWAEVVAGITRRSTVRAAAETGLARLWREFEKTPYWRQFPPTPITPDRLTQLRWSCLRQLGASLPVGYSQLLRTFDGFVYNGLTLYGSVPRPDISLNGFMEMNTGLRLDRPEYADYLVFGDNGLDYLVYRISDSGYLAVAMGGPDVYEIFDSFDELLVYALEKVL